AAAPSRTAGLETGAPFAVCRIKLLPNPAAFVPLAITGGWVTAFANAEPTWREPGESADGVESRLSNRKTSLKLNVEIPDLLRMSGFRPVGPRSPHTSNRWIDRWLAACSELAELERSNPMTDAVIDEIDGRMIRIGDKWLADFASCNYLGFDLEREIIAAVPAYIEKWGTHPSWSRLLGSPVLYSQIEERLAALVGAEDTLVLPTITLIHMSVIPVLAGSGTIYVDSRAHNTIYEGSQLAGARGATRKRCQ